MRRLARIVAVFTGVVLLPSAALAQAGIAGNAKDTSGAVLPGVTVEASSPALIEKTRSAVTDGRGNYKIENLRPGIYTVTFTLAGFNTYKREGIELAGSFVAAVDADMKVGAIEESITVTGETPLVDVQSSARQRVLSKDVVDALPTGRMYYTLGVLLPGVSSNTSDVGGALGDTMGSLITHGSRTGDQRVLENGLNVMTLQTQGGNIGVMVPNTSAAQEVAIDTSGVAAERQTGGVAINFVPRDGGNTMKATAFASFANENMASSNLTQRLKDQGIDLLNSIKKTWDINPAFGGPIMKDKLWYWVALRYNGAQNYALGMYYNANQFDPNSWTYVPDTTHPALNNKAWWKDASGRFTWQMDAKNKFAGTWDQQSECRCPNTVTATRAPEAALNFKSPTQQLLHAEWFSPVTSRFLIEVVGLHRTERWGNMQLYPDTLEGVTPAQFALYPQLIGVTEQLSVNGQQAGLQYHGPPNAYNNNFVPSYHYRGSVSYVTGTHSVKVGFNEAVGYLRNGVFLTSNTPVRYQLANGVPNTVFEFLTPYENKSDQDHDFGLYAQDKLTFKRLTLNYGVRYDWYKSSFPAQHLGPATLLPNRNADLPGEDNLNWKDVVPRFGMAYDIFGDGKTAIKVSANKYVLGQALGGFGSNTNPILRLTGLTSTNGQARAWTDANNNFVVDCNLASTATQDLRATGGDFCGALPSSWGTLTTAQITDSALRTGWGVRPYNWEFSVGVQRQLLPRVSAEVSYFRRLYGNFVVVPNLAYDGRNGCGTATDHSGCFDQFSIVAPVNPLLESASGQAITGLVNVKPANFANSPVNTSVLSDSLGKQIEHWNGVDFSFNARLQNGVLLQGGVGIGRTVTDNCDIVSKYPEISFALALIDPRAPAQAGVWTPLSYCNVQTPFLTQVKGVGSWTVPKVAVQVSGTFQSNPSQDRAANFVLSSAQAAQTLGRSLAGNAPNITVDLIRAGQVYGERVNQLDLRFAKIFKFGSTRTNVNLDVYNVLNPDTVLIQNNSYATLFRPTSILQARFLKVSAQFDF